MFTGARHQLIAERNGDSLTSLAVSPKDASKSSSTMGWHCSPGQAIDSSTFWLKAALVYTKSFACHSARMYVCDSFVHGRPRDALQAVANSIPFPFTFHALCQALRRLGERTQKPTHYLQVMGMMLSQQLHEWHKKH